MAQVTVYEGEDISSAIKRFNRKVAKDDILNDYRRHEYFRKPSEVRKEKAARARKLKAIANAKNKKAEY